MATTPSNLPVPSESPRDLKFNAGKVDEFVTSNNHYYIDRFGGKHRTIVGINYDATQAILNYGYITKDSFEDGSTLSSANECLRWKSNGEYYRWGGTFPKVVPAGSTPDSTGGLGPDKWIGVGDSSLRSDLASSEGASLVNVGQDSLSSLLANRNFTPDVYGAVGDGVADDTAAVAAAMSGTKEKLTLTSGKKYLVTSINNPKGKPLIGSGQLVKQVTGGVEMQNSYVDAYQRMTGQENLAAWFKALLQPTAAPKIVFSGDSTTAGDSTSVNFKINLLVAQGVKDRGLQTAYGLNSVNKGHSGASTGAWNSTYVDEDITENADLYVVRWGINDVKDVDTFATNLRAGLTKYRAARPFATNSILLMMPNSTYDIPNGRDAKWYEQLYNVYVQAARDFKCAFIDTYALTQNSKGLAGILLDNPYGDGRGIHPNDTFNSIIAGYITDMVAPMGLHSSYGRNRIRSTAGGEDATVAASAAPSSYSDLITVIRTLPANGWPLDGNAITFRTMDGTLIQHHFGYKDADRGTMYTRFGRANTLSGETESWSPFYQNALRFQSANIAVTGVYGAGTSKCNRTGTQVIIDGKMTTSTPTNIGAGTTIGTVPSGYRPTRDIMYGTATLVNAGATTFVQVPVNVQLSGAISVAGTATGVSYIYLNISYDIQ